jgi:hypothetical protein
MAKSGKHLSTNVAKFAAALLPTDIHGIPQWLCYLEGVGTHHGEWHRGGMLASASQATLVVPMSFSFSLTNRKMKYGSLDLVGERLPLGVWPA